jgi:hypothetical protein
MKVGDFVIVNGWRNVVVKQVVKVMPLTIDAKEGSWRHNRHRRDEVLACFSEADAANRLADSLNGAAGERERRITAAQDDCATRINAAREAYEKTAQRLIRAASADRGPEGQDAAGGLIAEADESAVPAKQGDAHD